MARDTSIEWWTNHTFNSWWGCPQISPACDHCYTEAWANRVGLEIRGHGRPRQGDLVAVAVFKILRAEFVTRVSAGAVVALSPFDICAAPRTDLEGGKVVVDLAGCGLLFMDDTEPMAVAVAMLIEPVRSLIRHRRAALFSGRDRGAVPFLAARTARRATSGTMEART